MTKKQSKKIPCVNVARDIMQPVRLHAKLLNKKKFLKRIEHIKLVDYVAKDNFYIWYYSKQIPKSNYYIEREAVSLGTWKNTNYRK